MRRGVQSRGPLGWGRIDAGEGKEQGGISEEGCEDSGAGGEETC